MFFSSEHTRKQYQKEERKGKEKETYSNDKFGWVLEISEFWIQNFRRSENQIFKKFQEKIRILETCSRKSEWFSSRASSYSMKLSKIDTFFAKQQ